MVIQAIANLRAHQCRSLGSTALLFGAVWARPSAGRDRVMLRGRVKIAQRSRALPVGVALG